MHRDSDDRHASIWYVLAPCPFFILHNCERCYRVLDRIGFKSPQDPFSIYACNLPKGLQVSPAMSDRVLHTPGLKALLSDLATAAKTPRAHHVMMKSEGDQVAHTWAEGAAVGGGNRRVVPPDAVGKHHAPRRPRVRILRPQLRLCMSIEHFQKSVCMRPDPLTGASAASVQRATAVVRPCPHRMHLILIASRVASSLQAR